MSERTQVWNCGGGVQSVTIAALMVAGKLPKPDIALMVDTGRERASTWEYLYTWVIPALAKAGIELEIIRSSDWTSVDPYKNPEDPLPLIPAFYENPNGTQRLVPGKRRLISRCSTEWKKNVVERWLIEYRKVKAVTQSFGFTTDETNRLPWMKRQENEIFQFKYPLIELGMSRDDCFPAIKELGWPKPKKSRCWMCPHLEPEDWKEVLNSVDRDKAIEFERQIQQKDPNLFLTDRFRPLAEAFISCSDLDKKGVD